VLRRGPGKCAAQIASAHAQLHRHEIVDIRRHAAAGKAQQHAAILDKLRNTVIVRAGDVADIGQDQHRHVTRQRVFDRAFARVRIGCQRARQIEHVVEIQEKFEHAWTSDHGDAAIRRGKLGQRLFERRALGVPVNLPAV